MSASGVDGVDEQVDAGGEQLGGEVALGSALFFGARHLEAVRHHDAVEAHLVAEQAVQDGARTRRDLSRRVQRWHGDVGRHHGVDARRDGGAERHEVGLLERLAGVVDARRRRVRVLARAAVAGEVLDRRDLARVVDARDEGRDEAPGALGVRPIGPCADDRVARVAVHVRHG